MIFMTFNLLYISSYLYRYFFITNVKNIINLCLIYYYFDFYVLMKTKEIKYIKYFILKRKNKYLNKIMIILIFDLTIFY
jgi:hypothetical protein